ncbi:uncharacterized protein [Mytilus edulis]|uniref:uncharacterized protein n=1 Tax=Mytilus edulis TaxID=6550 RepID=UPI0039F0565B
MGEYARYTYWKLTTQSNIAKACSSEESVTKGQREKETEGFSKTELLILFCGALSGIIGLLGFLGILKCVRKRMRMSTSNHEEKPSEEEVHSSEEQEMQEAFALHEGFYETIDDSHLDSISVLQTCNPNPGNDDESLDSVSSTHYIDDRSSYLDPVSSPITRKSSWLNEEQSQETYASTRISSCIQNQTSCNPNLKKDSESSISEISTNCNDDQSNYLQPLCSLISNDSSFHTEKHSHKVFPSANNSTCIADQTTCYPYLAIEVDDSDDSSTEFSEDATHDRSSYLHPHFCLDHEREMLRSLIILFLSFKSSVVRGLTEKDNNTCVDRISREYYCCSNYEEINDKCIKCKLGFMSRRGNSCEPCTVNYFGNDCSRKCMCKELQRCDNVEGCVDQETTRTLLMTTQSNIATSFPAEKSVTTIHVEEQFDGLSKTEVLILLCGALSGIIILLGILGISNCIKKCMCISKPKHKTNVEEEVDEAEALATQETFELHETLYESIDDSHLDSILLPITFSSNLEKDVDSSSVESITQCNEDRAEYLHPFTSRGTKASSGQDEQTKNAMPSTSKPYCEVGQSLNSPYHPYESEASCYEIPVDCTYDRASYLHRNTTLVDDTSYCHISEIDKSLPLSE